VLTTFIGRLLERRIGVEYIVYKDAGNYSLRYTDRLRNSPDGFSLPRHLTNGDDLLGTDLLMECTELLYPPFYSCVIVIHVLRTRRQMVRTPARGLFRNLLELMCPFNYVKHFSREILCRPPSFRQPPV
jgi:hypothetical protein